jgi:hypothetical protein
MRTVLAFILALSFPPPVHRWVPRFERTYIRMEVGETHSIGVRAIPTNSPPAWKPWIFLVTDPAIAHVDAVMTTPAAMDVLVTGLAPGQAGLYVEGVAVQLAFVTVDVACGSEEAISVATPVVKTIVGKPVTLRAETPIAHRTAFTWYRGRSGDESQPIAGAAGPELTLTPETRGTEYVWVRATTPCSTSTAELRIDAQPPKQRAARR